MRIKNLLDCTLRDGGYINDWKFGRNNITNIFERQISSNVDVIEIGFLDDRREFDPDRTIQPDTKSFDKIFGRFDTKDIMVVAMIDYGTCKIENLSPCEESCIDGIRVIFKKELMKEAVDYCSQVKKLGYKVFTQAVSITSYSDDELRKLISLVNVCQPYAVSMVDTYGLLDSEKLSHIISVIDEKLDSEIILGFHAHNNFQLGFSNVITMLSSDIKRGVLVDGSLYGMGKSAGNAPIELIALYMNDHCSKHYVIDQMQEAITTSLLDIFRLEPWGYTLFYYIAAANECHPNYVSYLINKRTLSITAINEILQKIPKEEKLGKNIDLLEGLYLDYQNEKCNDRNVIVQLKELLKGKSILAVGPGTSVKKEKESIYQYIKEEKPIVIAINYIPQTIKMDYIFITNALRYKQMASDLTGIKDVQVIATSNVTKTGGIFEYLVNYSRLIDTDAIVPDNSLLMFIELIKNMDVKQIALAGFDGYSADEINYVQSGMEYSFAIEHANELNEHVTDYFEHAKEIIDIKFVTTSRYGK